MTNIKNIKNNKKSKKYTEGEIALTFNLDRVFSTAKVLNDWINIDANIESLNSFEQYLFQKIIVKAQENIESWNEEDLKMNFLAHIIELSNFAPTKTIRTFFDKQIEADVDGIHLKTTPDFTMAKGLRNVATNPYFHFQEYKRETDPNGDALGQLLEAFLIAQVINNNGKPMYGAYIIGRYWYFVTLQAKEYCVSPSYDSTKEQELMQIISILRHFKVILETVLII